MSCSNCGSKFPPSVEMTPGGAVTKCDACQMIFSGPEKRVAKAEENPRRPAASKAASAERVDPRSLVKQAKRELKERRRRIRQLKRELAAEEKAEAELARLLDAADGKSLAVVRHIDTRTTG